MDSSGEGSASSRSYGRKAIGSSLPIGSVPCSTTRVSSASQRTRPRWLAAYAVPSSTQTTRSTIGASSGAQSAATAFSRCAARTWDRGPRQPVTAASATASASSITASPRRASSSLMFSGGTTWMRL